MTFPEFDERNGGSGCANNTAMNPFEWGRKNRPRRMNVPQGLFCCGSEKAQSRGLRFFCAFFRRAAMPPLPYQEGGFFHALFDSKFDFYL